MNLNPIFIFFWIISAILIVMERRLVRLLVYMGVFSLLSAGCMLLFAAPDVAMAQAVVSGFSTILFIITFEQYYGEKDHFFPRSNARKGTGARRPFSIRDTVFPLCFTLFLAVLFIRFIPLDAPNTYLKMEYLSRFHQDIGGENAVTAIYMGYRMYDTMFEALTLLVSVVAVVHLSWYKDLSVPRGKPSATRNSDIAFVTIRILSPLLILFAIYMVMNGHISPGGGFQGGVIAASFFVCRYMIYDVYDIRIDRVVTMEKFIFSGIAVLGMFSILLSVGAFFPIPKTFYLVLMNLLIGIKVSCGFFIIFYRFVALERRWTR